jgi:hypothetical protein
VLRSCRKDLAYMGLFGVPRQTSQAPPHARSGRLVSRTSLRARPLPCKTTPAARLPRYAQIDLLSRARLPRCRGERVGGENLDGGSSRHFTRVTSPFRTIHCSIYVPSRRHPSPSLTVCSSPAQQVLRLFSLPLLLVDCSSILH